MNKYIVVVLLVALLALAVLVNPFKLSESERQHCMATSLDKSICYK